LNFSFIKHYEDKIKHEIEDRSSVNPWNYPDAAIITMFLAFIVGIALALPFKILKEKEVTLSMLGPRQELINQILSLTTEKDNLKDSLLKEREQLGKIEQSLGQKVEEGQVLMEKYGETSLLAGTRGIQGPGIILKLEESNDTIPIGEDLTPYLIHQEDLLNITNELWAAGAEAMAIRSGDTIERIVTTTAIRCVGPVVNVNNQPMAPPFEILTIGNPQGLRQALEGPGRVLQPLAFFNIKYTLTEQANIVLPPYSGAINTRFAKSTEEPANKQPSNEGGN
jgi:uncharacterized protein YlxW (UPF0749 family)